MIIRFSEKWKVHEILIQDVESMMSEISRVRELTAEIHVVAHYVDLRNPWQGHSVLLRSCVAKLGDILYIISLTNYFMCYYIYYHDVLMITIETSDYGRSLRSELSTDVT